uniref:Replicase n=1 Tax=Chrysanthemum virus B TaxID=12165 RepID=A9CMG0_CVB|nr:replicase [Chrysanthemum virus B]
MSLTYRSPLEENVGAYDSSVQAAIASTSANYYREAEVNNFQFFNYYLRPIAKRHLIEAGIYLSPYSAVPHSHAACKTLENHLLYNVLPPLVDNRFHFVGIKQSKLEFLKLRNSKLSTISKINRFVTSADKARYGSDFVKKVSKPHVGFKRHELQVETPTLRDLLPSLKEREAKYLFLHDEIHYWDPKQLITFLEVIRPEVVYATLVYPPEILSGATMSLHKWCYTFKIVGKDLLFYPDGVLSEGYQQKIKNGYLLKARRIVLPNGDVYMVDLIHSKFAHHLISITRGELLSTDIRSFGPFEATACSGLEPLVRNMSNCFPVPYSVVSRTYLYLSTLRKPDIQSSMAKLRQLVDEPTGIEMKFVKDFAALVISASDIQTMICPQRVKLFFGRWCKQLPKFIATKLEVVKTVSLDDFVTFMAPYCFDVQLETVDFNYDGFFPLYDVAEADFGVALPELIDETFTMGNVAVLCDRITRPYVGRHDRAIVEKKETLLKIREASLKRLVINLIIGNCFSNGIYQISASKTTVYIFHIFENCSNLLIPLKEVFRKLNNKEWVSEAIQIAISHMARRVKITWFWSTLLWFLSETRLNVWSLDDKPEGKAMPRDFILQFATIVSDITGSCNRQKLIKRGCPPQLRYCRAKLGECDKCKGTDGKRNVENGASEGATPEQHANNPEATETSEGNEMPDSPADQGDGSCPPAAEEHKTSGFEEVVELPPLLCICGLCIGVSTMRLPSGHNFKAPDQLKKRKAGWYSLGGVPYHYNGGSHTSLGWPDWIRDWMFCNGIDSNYYNCCLYQVYEKGGAIGFHQDNESIFEVGSMVHTCNLDGHASFGIMCTKRATDYDLKPGTHFTMPENFQLTHKHALLNCSANRASLTFRRMKTSGSGHGDSAQKGTTNGGVAEDEEGKTSSGKDEPPVDNSSSFGEETEDVPNGRTAETPGMTRPTQVNGNGKTGGGASSDVLHELDLELGHLKIRACPAALNLDNFVRHCVAGDGNCFWYSLEKATALQWNSVKEIAARCMFTQNELQEKKEAQFHEGAFAEDEAIICAVATLKKNIIIYVEEQRAVYEYAGICSNADSIYLLLRNEHFEYIEPKNSCLLHAIAHALNRQFHEVLTVVERVLGSCLSGETWVGQGIDVADLEFYFGLFDIRACVISGPSAATYNEEGRVVANFILSDGHITYSSKNPSVDIKILKGEQTGLSVSNTSVIELNANGTMLTYRAELGRARVLADSLEAGSTGIISSKLFNQRPNLGAQIRTEGGFKDSQVCCILGTFGAGKSSLFTEFTKKNPGKGVFYVSPRKALAQEHESKCMSLGKRRAGTFGRETKERGNRERLGVAKHWKTLTFETFLKQVHMVKPGMALIIDEIQLYPPGYLDLVCLLLVEGVHIYVGGDPCQSDYDNERDRAWLSSMRSDIEQLLEGQNYKFNVQSHRFNNENFRGRLPCEIVSKDVAETLSEEHLLYTGCEELVQIMDEYSKIFLVSSFEEKKIVETHFPMNEQRKVYTFGESTGLNFKVGTIIITNVSAATSEKRWLTALSRFSENVCFVNLLGTDWNGLFGLYKHRALGLFLSRRAQLKDLLDHLPGHPQFQSGFSTFIGRDAGKREEKLIGDPWLKCMIDLGQTEDVEEVELLEEVMQEEWFKTHLPQADLEGVRARWVHKIMLKEAREVRMGDIVSEQFTDDYPKELGTNLTNAAERFETIYPRHRASDTVTFLMAVKKRLRFSRPAVEKAKLQEAKLYGKFLLNEFLKKVPLKQAHNTNMMERAKFDFEEKKTSKSAAIIENHAGRSCRDWLIDVGLIFSKSQLCTKFDNRFRGAKAAQSIVCFQHAVLCRFAPYMRYIEAKLHEALPSRFYIHSGKGLDELNEWVIKGKFEGICTESDYEAFDASQDQYIVAFELALMEYLGLPRDLIEDYAFIKCHLGSKLGNFAIMRFSGEASTFLFNTMANMLFTFLRYNIKDSEHICFAGDDMCASERLCIKKDHEGFLSKLKLKAKVFFVDKPTFCGWHLCSDGIYKKPQLVLERMCIAKEKNNLANCLDNYAIEVSYAYKLGERAVNRMDEEELEAAYNCVRIIIKNKKLLKSDILSFYSSIEKQI